MLNRIALFAASLAASLTLALALAAAGFAPGAAPAASAAVAVDPALADAVSAPQVQVDTVYVAPPPPQQTVTVHKVVKGSGGESEGSEGNEVGD